MVPDRGIFFRSSFLVFLNLLLVLAALQIFLPRVLPSSGLDLSLPQVLTSAPVTKHSLTLTIDKKGNVFIAGQRHPATENELSVFLDSLDSFKTSLLIKADHRASIGQLTRIWDAARRKGVRQISIATND